MTSDEIAGALSVLATAVSRLRALCRDYEHNGRDIQHDPELALGVQECIAIVDKVSRAFKDATSDPITSLRLTHIAEDLNQLSERLDRLHDALEFFAAKPNDPFNPSSLGARPALVAAISFAQGDLVVLERRFRALSAYYAAPDVLIEDEEDPGDVRLWDAFAQWDAERPGDVSHMAGAEPASLQHVSPPVAPVRTTLVPVMFATDRPKISDSPTSHQDYGDRFDDKRPLSYGLAEVSIPLGKRHKIGRLERPTLWKLQFAENPEKHIVISTCEEKELSAWTAIARERMAAAGQQAALVFIHGFNVSFSDAIRRAGQIGLDLRFRGLVTAFSWCSEATIPSYITDERNSRVAAPRLLEFFQTLRDVGVNTIHVIAHSMGSLALMQALRAPVPGPVGHPALNEVVFAAPDCDAVDFKQALKDFKGKAKRYTVYGSQTDRALLLSKELRSGYPRAGDGGPHLFVADGVETIDASAVGGDLLGLGHSYFGSKRTVLDDLFYVIRHSLAPLDRSGMDERQSSGMKYWVFVP